MSQTDILRPVSVRFAGDGVAVPSGTLAAVTSDNSDATYIRYDVTDGSPWNLRVGSHTPSANYQRHRIRGRIRARTDGGTCLEDIDVGRGTEDHIQYSTVLMTGSFTELVSAWFQDADYGLATSGALADLNIGGGWPNDPSGVSELRTAECYIDIDCRLRPTYSPQVRDAAGADQSGGTVTDTNQPVLWFGAVSYDGLPSLNWSLALKAGSTTVESWSGSGVPPAEVQASGLADGAYTATFVVRSTIRGADPFEHQQIVSFSVENLVPPPSPPLVTVTPEFGGYRVTWVDPGGQTWDGDYVVAEVWRADCTGEQRIATVPDALNGDYLDLAIPQLDPQPVPGPDCEVSAESCDITYSVRYWGYVSTSVELPDNLPAALILGWPSTAGSIPSGWSRVTALDGRYPRGTTITGAPTATGGATSHSHTTPQHRHRISAHNHELGGNTGDSNTSTTTQRANGEAYSAADQPHSHARPLNVVSHPNGDYTGYNTPATGVVTNAPPTREVIWIASDGARTAYPVGAVAWSAESVSGWTDDANSAGRFLKGAAAAGNGGTNSGAADHQHTINSHTHTGITHTHAVADTGLSNPASSQEAGGGSGTPRFLGRHQHPMEVEYESTGPTNPNTGGTAFNTSLEPRHRRLRVLRNTGGGIQTRIIGLYLGTVGALDPLLTICDGSNGTPDMRNLFARDKGTGSVNALGGSDSHSHVAGLHVHSFDPHRHLTNVLQSEGSQIQRATSPDTPGSVPTFGHGHDSTGTAYNAPTLQTVSIGNTDEAANIPPYREAHFVRVDGQAGGSLPTPELKVTEFSSASVPSFTYSDDLDRISTFDERIAIVTDRSHDYPRLVADSIPLDGGLHTVSNTLAGEDMTLSIAAEGKPAIDRLERVLSSDRVYFSPLGGTPGWYAPGSWRVTAPAPDVKVVQVSMVRQPWPATPDPAEYL